MKNPLLTFVAGLEQAGRKITRLAIVVVFVWIGALKFFTYEADGIVPFVANSPFMSFFYSDPDGYKAHMNKEGELVPANHAWHKANNTYGFSYGLGIFLISIGIMTALYKQAPLLSISGSALIAIMSIGTITFLITTPETWVPPLGDAQHGFPYLSGRGRMVLKDLVILGGAIINMSETARFYLNRQQQ